MKDDEIKARVAELAEIEDHKVAQVNIRSRKQELEGPPTFPPGENPTLGFRIKRIRNQSRLCEIGCGDIVDYQVVEYRFGTSPAPHWKTRCANCQKYLHPNGHEFMSGGHNIANAYVSHFIANPQDKPVIRKCSKPDTK